MNKIALIVIGVLFYLSSAFVSYAYFSSQNESKVARENYTPPVQDVNSGDLDDGDKTEECPINGEYHTESRRQRWENRRPLGIMVENGTDSRPQSGLNDADSIYEIVAEGGVTRFLTIYYCKDPEIVGPVRSARIYFIRFLQGYGDYPLYAHVGGANTPGPADALGEIQDLGWAGYNDLDQFYVPFPNYWRDSDRLPNVATEHTMYTNTQKLWEYAAETNNLTNVNEDGEAWDETFEGWTFADGNPSAGDVSSISYGFWDFNTDQYGVEWTYEAENNRYLRSNGGQPHFDKNTDEQLYAKNVIVVFTEESEVDDGYENGTHMFYDTISGGDALVFQNGEVIEATWEKDTFEDPIKFYDESGEEVSIVRGKVWISVLPLGNEVEY